MGSGLQPLRPLHQKPRTTKCERTAAVLRRVNRRIFPGSTALVVSSSNKTHSEHLWSRFGFPLSPDAAKDCLREKDKTFNRPAHILNSVSLRVVRFKHAGRRHACRRCRSKTGQRRHRAEERSTGNKE